MLSKRNKAISYHYSLSPQKPKKSTRSKIIILKSPYNKLLSPQPHHSDFFIEQTYLKSHPSEKNKPKQRIVSTFKNSNDSKGFLTPIDLNNFIFSTGGTTSMSVIGLKEAIRDKD